LASVSELVSPIPGAVKIGSVGDKLEVAVDETESGPGSVGAEAASCGSPDDPDSGNKDEEVSKMDEASISELRIVINVSIKLVSDVIAEDVAEASTPESSP
jgi:hypothetical protein